MLHVKVDSNSWQLDILTYITGPLAAMLYTIVHRDPQLRAFLNSLIWVMTGRFKSIQK